VHTSYSGVVCRSTESSKGSAKRKVVRNREAGRLMFLG